MTVGGVIWRFALAYALGATAIGFALDYFGLKGGAGMNVAPLIACVILTCGAFAKANKRYFTAAEKAVVVLGFIFIDIALQSLSAMAVLSQKDLNADMSRFFLMAIALVAAIHAITIYFFVGFSKRFVAKSQGTSPVSGNGAHRE